MDSMSLTCSVARKAVIRNTHKGHQGGLAQEYRASFKQVQRSRMAALRATLRAKARASVPALRQLERRPVFLHCRALSQKLSLWLNTSNSLNPCTRSLTENSLPYRQLLLRCSNSCIHAVVRCQQIGLKIRFCSLNGSLFASQNRIFILNFLSSSLRALFSVRLLESDLQVGTSAANPNLGMF